jgi:hypothetical protein
MTTYEDVHTGDVVFGHEEQPWGVQRIEREPTVAVTLVRHGQTVTGYPPPGTPVTVLTVAGVEPEKQAFELLALAGLNPQVISEVWEG